MKLSAYILAVVTQLPRATRKSFEGSTTTMLVFQLK